MKKAQLVIVFAMSILILSSCGSEKNNETANTAIEKESVAEENNDESFDEDAENEPVEKTANIIDKIWLDHYEEEFINSGDYNPLFSERCFYVKGVRVHIPTTVRGFEKLFGTTFSTVRGGYDTVYIDDDDHVLQVEFIRADREKLSGDSEYDEKMKDMPIIGFYYDDTPYGKEHCILNVYDVTFEPVPQEGKDSANEYGYDCTSNTGDTDKIVYRFYPDCYQAYYLYQNGKLSNEFIAEGTESISDYSDVEYGDVTLDALDEMFIFQDDAAYVFTYDTVDNKLRRIYYTDDAECLSTERGTLIYSYDPRGSQDYYELTKYYVFNRYGKEWKLAELERWQDDNYNAHRVLNGEEVDEDTFIDAERLYGNPGAFEGAGVELTVWGFRNNNGNYERIMNHKEELSLDAVGYDPDAKPDGEIDEEENDDSIDGDYDTLRAALIEAGFDVDTYGLEGFEVEVSAPDGYINVREGGGLEYNIVMQIDNGARFYISDCHVDSSGRLWGAIREPEFIGYIALSQVQQVH